MDLNDLTQKSQEALHDAQTIALRYGQTEVDGEHLLLALLNQRDGIAARLLADAGADPDRLRTALEAELARRPRVSGPGVAPGQIQITHRLSRLLDTAKQEADRLDNARHIEKAVGFCGTGAVNVQHRMAMRQQVVGHHHAMTTEVDALGAHVRRRPLLR